MENLTYRQISFDTAHIAPGHPVKATFFEAAPYAYVDGSTRVTEFDEKTIVRWLMLCPPSRHIILEELGLPATAFYQPEVVRPFYSPGEGDLDLILCPQLWPREALALECKRVKVESVNAGQDKINKLQDVAGGVRQANKLYNGPFAFFQTYLAIITEVEASGQAERNIPNRGVRSDTTPQRGTPARPHSGKLWNSQAAPSFTTMSGSFSSRSCSRRVSRSTSRRQSASASTDVPSGAISTTASPTASGRSCDERNANKSRKRKA